MSIAARSQPFRCQCHRPLSTTFATFSIELHVAKSGHFFGTLLRCRNGDVCEALLSGDWVIEQEGPSRYRPERRSVLRKVGLIHEDHRYEAMMRNLSRGGCMVEGLLDVPMGTPFVVDFGEGQLAVATVRRSAGSMQGLEFEHQLVDDGACGL